MLLGEVVRTVLGTGLVTLGIAVFVVTIRAATVGKRAFHANKRVTHTNPMYAVKGMLRADLDVRERRSCSGMAINLKTGKLQRQEKLSAEAIDEVIGRQM